MTAVLGPLVVDAAEPAVLQSFWADVLGTRAQQRLLRFCSQDRSKSVKNRVHLDVHVDDADRLIARGARLVADHRPAWVTLADVEGNEFCAFPDPARRPGGAPAEVFAVCTDSDRPEQLAHWWAPVVGARVGAGPDGTPRWLHGCAGWNGLVWKFVRVNDARVVPNRWRPTVIDGVDLLLAAGATTVGADQALDPQGNEISVGRPVTSAG